MTILPKNPPQDRSAFGLPLRVYASSFARCILICMLVALFLLCAAQNQQLILTINEDQVVRRFDPSLAFGAGLDGHERGENALIFSPKAVASMKAAGFQRFTYRLRTELAGEAWHWNPRGIWSDSQRNQGYWTSDSKPQRAINASFGYRLPRRGNTIDQANNDDYSRINDDDTRTFWKSNPYLDPTFGGESYSSRPQWVVLDLGNPKPIANIRIAWGDPYAASFELQYWNGPSDPYDETGNWFTFPSGRLSGSGGTTAYHCPALKAQFVRVLLKASRSASRNYNDKRDGIGFAIREIWIGHLDSNGGFEDWVDHAKNHDNQSLVYVSSTDPWHRQRDIDTKIEQPGFDRFFRSSLTKGHPTLMSTSALYDTPENVAAQAQWLKARHYPVAGFEIGEESDGQVVSAENYAALYIRMADSIRHSFPNVEIGGPSFQTVSLDFKMFPCTDDPWLARFVKYLRDRKRLADYAFCSFEWYPFDDVNQNPDQQLPLGPGLLAASVNRMKQVGMGDIPWIVTEYGFSSYGAEAEVDLPGAIFNMDCALTTLRLGGRASFLYGLEPNELIEEKPPAFGNNMLFLKDLGNARLPTFYSAWLLNTVLCAAQGTHSLLGCEGETEQIGCYPIRRPDGSIEVALLNRLPQPAVVALRRTTNKANWDRWEYSPNQYRWHADKDDGRPSLNSPPKRTSLRGNDLHLPGYSITVLTERR